MSQSVRADDVKQYILSLHDGIVNALQSMEPKAQFVKENIENGPSLAKPRVLEYGEVIEKAAVNFSHTVGETLPEAATKARPELAGSAFSASSISLIVHPTNPYAPTTHANFRFFLASKPDHTQTWWFGGGFDLTPYYGFEEDAIHWHQCASKACQPFSPNLYPRLKKSCDEYFYLPHRNETRGIGGLFFDDWDEGGFETAFEFFQSAGNQFLPAYLPILEKRMQAPYGEKQREFQLYRRGRYVEFNLLYDRGTRYGIQSGRRIESVLASLPPVVHWQYDYQPEPGSEEAKLYSDFLKPRDWLKND